MIKNYEEITKDFSLKEIQYYIPLIIAGLKSKIGQNMSISTPDIIDGLQKYEIREKGKASKVRPERIRMMIRHIIVNDLLPGLVSGGKGFFIANTKKEIEDCIISQRERIKAQETKLNAWIRQRNLNKLSVNPTDPKVGGI